MSPTGDVPVTDETERHRDRGAIFAWLYLALVIALLVLAVWFNDRDTTTAVSALPASTTTTSSTLAGIPAQIDVVVDRKIATISGAVPDEGARVQLIRIAEDRFGNGNVIDDLTIDPAVDLKSGLINFTGIADEGDLAPEQLQLNAGADLGLAAGSFDIEFVEPQFEPAVIDIMIGELPVVIAGKVPTESDRDRLIQSAEAVYGEGNVDVEGVVVEPSDIEDAAITISGLTRPGDTSSADLVTILQTDFRTAAVTDDSEVDVSDEALTAFEAELEAVLAEKPILFDTGTSTISDEGRENLLVIAEAIQALPGRGVEIIGHTDDTGGDTVNQTLSENRAVSVKDALVELGIDPDRLTTSGRGSSEPAVPNTSAENRARNRRIQFIFDRN